MDGVTFRKDTATAHDIEQHLRACSADFSPPLDTRVDLAAYAAKLYSAATTCEAWDDHELVGLVAYYRNDHERAAYITSVSTLARYRARGLGRALLEQALRDVDHSGYRRTDLEVGSASHAAVGLYRSVGFAEVGETGNTARMSRPIPARQPAARDEPEEGEPADE